MLFWGIAGQQKQLRFLYASKNPFDGSWQHPETVEPQMAGFGFALAHLLPGGRTVHAVIAGKPQRAHFWANSQFRHGTWQVLAVLFAFWRRGQGGIGP